MLFTYFASEKQQIRKSRLTSGRERHRDFGCAALKQRIGKTKEFKFFDLFFDARILDEETYHHCSRYWDNAKGHREIIPQISGEIGEDVPHHATHEFITRFGTGEPERLGLFYLGQPRP